MAEKEERGEREKKKEEREKKKEEREEKKEREKSKMQNKSRPYHHLHNNIIMLIYDIEGHSVDLLIQLHTTLKLLLKQ